MNRDNIKRSSIFLLITFFCIVSSTILYGCVKIFKDVEKTIEDVEKTVEDVEKVAEDAAEVETDVVGLL
jgi:hypothetical protein